MVVERRRDAEYRIDLMEADMRLRGWLQKDLAKRARVSPMQVSRFFTGQRQSAPTAKKLAQALGYSLRRYLVVNREAVAS